MQAPLFDVKQHTHEHGLPNLIWYGSSIWPTQMMHHPEHFHAGDIKATHEGYFVPVLDEMEFHHELFDRDDSEVWFAAVSPLLHEYKTTAMADRPDLRQRIMTIIESELLAAGVQWSEDEVKKFASEIRSMYGYCND